VGRPGVRPGLRGTLLRAGLRAELELGYADLPPAVDARGPGPQPVLRRLLQRPALDRLRVVRDVAGPAGPAQPATPTPPSGYGPTCG
jgi:hypothetical protein